MTWYDGGKKPPEELAPLPRGESLPDNGSLFIGEKGVLLCRHGGSPRLLPTDQYADFQIDAVAGSDHYMQWTNACKGADKAMSHFDDAGPLTETVLLGTIAIRFPGQEIEWNSEELAVTNVSAANEFVRKSYRDGWEVKGLS